MYYLRTRPAADAIKFTVDVESLLINSNSDEINSSELKNMALLRGRKDGSPEKSLKNEEESKLGSNGFLLVKKKQGTNGKSTESMFEMCFNCSS